MFDFNSVLRAEPGNVQALCGRALLRLALDQQEVPAPPSQPGTGQVGWGYFGAGAAFLLTPQGQRGQGQRQAVLTMRRPSKPLELMGSFLSHPWLWGVLSFPLKSVCASQPWSAWMGVKTLRATRVHRLKIVRAPLPFWVLP